MCVEHIEWRTVSWVESKMSYELSWHLEYIDNIIWAKILQYHIEDIWTMKVWFSLNWISYFKLYMLLERWKSTWISYFKLYMLLERWKCTIPN